MYGLSLAIRYWRGDNLDDYVDGKGNTVSVIDDRAKEFTKSFYFWMCPFPKYVRKKLLGYLDDAKSGEIFNHSGYGDYYAHAYKTMNELGLVKVPPVKVPK